MELIKRTPEFSFYQKGYEHYRINIKGYGSVEMDNKFKAKQLLEMVRFLKSNDASKKAIKECLPMMAYQFLFQMAEKPIIKHDVALKLCKHYERYGNWEIEQ